MTQEIERLIKVSTLRDVEITLRQMQLEGQIVPDNVFEALKQLEKEYNN